MTSQLCINGGEINGINLAQYFPKRRMFNSVVYIHKKFLTETDRAALNKKETENEIGEQNTKDKSSKDSNDKTKSKHIDNIETKEGVCVREDVNNNSMLEQTIKFAKNLAPLAIPVSKDIINTSTYYTIKTSKKDKHKIKRPRENNLDRIENTTYKKEKNKNAMRTVRKEKEKSHRSYSLKTSVCQSCQSDNTLDDLNINQSLCCSLSEISGRDNPKKQCNKKNNQNLQKFAASESFEALATELLTVSGDTKIKIHLMNTKDRELFIENVRSPIISAIKECIEELNNEKEVNSELKTVQKIIRCDVQKLDNILEKLTCLEKKLDNNAINIGHVKKLITSQVDALKALATRKTSKLEELEKDLEEEELKVGNASEEEGENGDVSRRMDDRRLRGQNVIVPLSPTQINKENDNAEKNVEIMGCGEEVLGPLKPSSSVAQLGVKPDRPNRIPKRFCWTDAARKNMY